jgi:transposase
VWGCTHTGVLGQEYPPSSEPSHGNRDANRALYVIALCRMSRDERTRAYVAKRTAEGKSKKEIIRCLKRYIAREIYRILASPSLRSPSISGP